ncbi:hypothetical protein L208DRAFT_1256148, partial [Tricholoma matsutake]
LQKMDSNLFSQLTLQTVSGWIDQEGTAPHWSPHTLEHVKQANKPGGVMTWVGVLVGYPEVTEQIPRSLEQLRETSVPLTLITIHGIMIAQLQHSTPQIFKVPSPDGTLFRCSEVFVRKFIDHSLGWSMQCSTQAGRKIPADSDAILKKAFLCVAVRLSPIGRQTSTGQREGGEIMLY